MKQADLVFSGVGIVTGRGVGFADHLAVLDDADCPDPLKSDLSLTQFNPAPLLSDRRLLKTISPIDAIGLIGIGDLMRQISYEPTQHDPWRVGLFVGSPPAHAIDGALHHDAMVASRDSAGKCSIRDFGKSGSRTRPTAILSGLPNNTLCYGAMMLAARGPNSNYNCLEISGHTAVINAARAFRRGRLDFAVAGAFAGHTFEPNKAMLGRLGLSEVADGAVFLAMETRAGAASRQAKILATYVAGAAASDAMGPLAPDDGGEAMAGAIRAALTAGKVHLEDVGLILIGGHAGSALASIEERVINRLYRGRSSAYEPVVGSLHPLFGNLMEAGGLLEIAMCNALYERPNFPESLRLEPGARTIDIEKRYALILRSSVWGEYSCLLVRVD